MIEKKIFVIGWDGDGVVIESDESVRNVVNKRLGINIQKSDLTNWNALTEIVLQKTGDQKLADELTNNWFEPEVLKLASPNRQVLEVIEKCKQLPDTVQKVITTRKAKCADVTRSWLKKHIKGIDWDLHLHIRRPNGVIEDDEFKILMLKKYKVSFMSEDKTSTVERIIAEVPTCRVAYFNQPWNSEDTSEQLKNIRIEPTDGIILYRRIVAAREEFLDSK